MTLYPKNKLPFNEDLFRTPTSEYRGAPFWAWNCNITAEKISDSIDSLKEMGMGGAHIHCRAGLKNQYLSDDFMKLVSNANETMKKKKMRTYLYDEDRWPSGSAGGKVTKNQENRMCFLVLSPSPIVGQIRNDHYSMSAQPVRSDKRKLLAIYKVKIVDGWLADYKRIAKKEQSNNGYELWYAYLEISGDSPAFNNQAYVNTLDKKAVDEFIQVTYEAYARELGGDFGKSIFSMFTDEPQFAHKGRIGYAKEKKEIIIPFTDDLEESFTEVYGYSLLESLPELFWDLKDNQISAIRYQYHDHLCERFVTAFADNIGNWCRCHQLMLTGHMMGEPTLYSQTSALGEAMRCYRSFGLPGIDMLVERTELSTAKQAQSVSRQFGCPGVLSELYGGTNWDFDFRKHKIQGDWQAALGVTTRVHHLMWTSMQGIAKRDYPAPIGYQSPWYKEYHYVEDYFARINTLLTRGKSVVHIGVIHPIESYWLYWGSEEKTGTIRRDMDENFTKLVEWLLYSFQDFDFICESLLPTQSKIADISKVGFPVGEMTYNVILVPNCVTLRSTTLSRLKKWEECGGTLIFVGGLPEYVDAKPSQEIVKFTKKCKIVEFCKSRLLESIEKTREIDVRTEEGTQAENLVYQLREEDGKRIFFLAHVNKMADEDIPNMRKLTIIFKGIWHVTGYNPIDGSKEYLSVIYEGNKTVLKRKIYDHDSLLLVLNDVGKLPYEVISGSNIEKTANKWITIPIETKVPVTLSEPNVLLLDMAEYKLDGGPWQRREEILRIDTIVRKRLRYTLRVNHTTQPWVEKDKMKDHTITLRFRFQSRIEVHDAQLAIENEDVKIEFNNQPIMMKATGWYVDRAILKYSLGTVKEGENELLVSFSFGEKTDVEAMYLLGDFGVEVRGSETIIVESIHNLSFGDWTMQGLPFYGGNITYHIPVYIPFCGKLQIQASKFRNPLIKVTLNNDDEKVIAYSPYQAEFSCDKGHYQMNVEAFGNRYNTFGALHNCMESDNWCCPRWWYTKDEAWSYEYQLRKTGILKTPIIKVLRLEKDE